MDEGQTPRPLRDTGMLLLESNSPYLYLPKLASNLNNTPSIKEWNK